MSSSGKINDRDESLGGESSINVSAAGGAGPTDISSYLNYTPKCQPPPRPPSPPPPPQAQPAPPRVVQTVSRNSLASRKEDKDDLAHHCRIYGRSHLMIWGFILVVAYLIPTIWILTTNGPDYVVASIPYLGQVSTSRITMGLKTCNPMYKDSSGETVCPLAKMVESAWNTEWGVVVKENDGEVGAKTVTVIQCSYGYVVDEVWSYSKRYSIPASILSSLGFALLVCGALLCRFGWRANRFGYVLCGYLLGLISLSALLAATIIASWPTTTHTNFLSECVGWSANSAPPGLIGPPAIILFFYITCVPILALDAARKEIKRRIDRAERINALVGERSTLLS